MIFKGLKTRNARKKFLGALVIMAFVAFFANVATRYIVVSEADVATVGLAAAAIIVVLLFVMEKRKRKKKSGKKRRAKRRKRKRKR